MSGRPAPEPPPQHTEIVLVGALHWQHLYTPGYTFAHMRALLDRIRPDVVGVETPSDWRPTSALMWPSEISVTVPYALAHQLPIHGIDWVSFTPTNAPCFWPEDAPDPTEMEQRFRRQIGIHRGTAAWLSQLHFQEVPWDIASVHGNVADPRPDSLASLESLREDRIARNIHALAARYPGKRVVVVLGGLHLHTQPRRLRALSGVRLLDARAFLPLSEAEVHAWWRQEDLYPLLGATIDSWVAHGFPHVFDQALSHALLQRLATESPNSAAMRYYRARWELVHERYEEAAALLDSLLAQGSAARISGYEPTADWSWPPWKGITDKARFTRAILFDLQGNHQQAVVLYQRLLQMEEGSLRIQGRSARSYYDLRSYIETLIRTPYRGGAWETFRIQDSRRCAPAG